MNKWITNDFFSLALEWNGSTNELKNFNQKDWLNWVITQNLQHPSIYHHPHMDLQKNKNPKNPNNAAIKKLALKFAALLAGAGAGAWISVNGEGAGARNILRLSDKTTTINFCPFSQWPWAPLMK